ncbi:MAG TPA: SDR family oxidoreductase [Anaerolineae bacterium]|nr:SDR family oxidoreductase [Anaerolineae bacterium]
MTAHKDKYLEGKVCIVTGATSGIGKETARALAHQGGTVILLGHNPDKAAATIGEIKREVDAAKVDYLLADLSSQAEIYQLAEEFANRYDRLDVLVNNAGAFFLWRQESVDGIEMTFALNHLGYFLLTNLLLDTMIASAPARIINVSSGSHLRSTMNFDDLQGRRKYSGPKAYGQSKLANVLFTYELAWRLEGTGVTVNALHPGFVATTMGSNNGWVVRALRPLMNLRALSVPEGAETAIYLATSPEVEGVTGKYFIRCKAVPSSSYSYDAAVAKRLWRVSEEMTGLSQIPAV